MAIDRVRVHSIFVAAVENGGRQISPFQVEWEIHGDCVSPIRREIYARGAKGVSVWRPVAPAEGWSLEDFPYDWLPYHTLRHWGHERYGPYVVFLTARCRRCDKCRVHRMRLWAARAVCEISLAARTWHVSLTLTPQWHSRFAAKARQADADFDRMPYVDQFHARHRAIAVEIEKMLKRLRKGGSGYRCGLRCDPACLCHTDAAAFRFMMVVEPHTGSRAVEGGEGPNFGLPHYHLLMHEVGAPLSKRVLQAAWPYGFVGAKLVSSEGAWYVAKYLGKTLAARVRASQRYGGLLSA